jgi:hypothetical protein
VTFRDAQSASPDLLSRVGARLPQPVRRRLRPAAHALRSRTSSTRRSSSTPDAPVRKSLNTIGLETGTDKSSRIHNYLDVYEATLSHLRDDSFKMIEIGVHKGHSLAMWAEFFPKARIVGADIKKSCKQYETERIAIRIGNQGSPAFLERLARNHKPMLVVDDGSHRWQHQIDTFRALWPSVRPGGYFIIEDIHTSFGDDYAKTYGEEGGTTAYEYIARIVEGVVAGGRAPRTEDPFESYCRSTIESALMLEHAVIIKKKVTPSPGTA